MVEFQARLQELADAASRAARPPGADRALRRGRRRMRARFVAGGALLAAVLVAGAVGTDQLGLRTGGHDRDDAAGVVTSASVSTLRPLGPEAGDVVATGESQGVPWTVTFKAARGPNRPTEQLRLYAGPRRALVATLDSPLWPGFFLDDRRGWDGHAVPVVTPEGRRRAVLALASRSSGITRIRYELIRPDATIDVAGVPVTLPGKAGQVFVAFGPTRGTELYVAHLNADGDVISWTSNMVCGMDGKGKPLPRRPKQATEADLRDFRRQMAAVARGCP